METSVAVALITAFTSLVVALVSLFGAKAKIDAAKEDTAQKLAQTATESRANLDQAAERLRREFQLEFAAETAAKALLEDATWPLRTFATIENHLGGFKEDELRQLLVRAGAVRFFGRGGKELWGLLSRNVDRLGLTDPEDPTSPNNMRRPVD
jgi:hypothetical protein